MGKDILSPGGMKGMRIGTMRADWISAILLSRKGVFILV
jgi:hypothetical protein